MKIKFTLIAISLVFIINVNAQNWKATGALAASNPRKYLVGATSVGNDVFAINISSALVYSTDLGVTWSASRLTNLPGEPRYILGIENRLYISNKINLFDYELRYSTDKGLTWKPDTVGFPTSSSKTGKVDMVLKYMENGYILAHNNLQAFYKKIEDTKWTPSKIDFTVVDIAATKDKWLAIGPGKILQSTNNGGTWTQISTSGLPANFQANKICTSGKRIYICNAPAAGGQDIYFSDDGGSSWKLTNSSGKFTHANPWILSLYAVEDYVFATILTDMFYKGIAPYIMSSTKEPNFSVGDNSGLNKDITVIPFFFHVKNKLFTVMWDLYSSEPGFKGESNPSTGIDFAEIESKTITVYPNPASRTIQIKAGNNEISKIEIISLTGKKVLEQNFKAGKQIDISQLNNGVYFIQATSTNGQTTTSKFVKN